MVASQFCDAAIEKAVRGVLGKSYGLKKTAWHSGSFTLTHWAILGTIDLIERSINGPVPVVVLTKILADYTWTECLPDRHQLLLTKRRTVLYLCAALLPPSRKHPHGFSLIEKQTLPYNDGNSLRIHYRIAPIGRALITKYIEELDKMVGDIPSKSEIVAIYKEKKG